MVLCYSSGSSESACIFFFISVGMCLLLLFRCLEFNVEEHSFNLRTSSTVRIKCALEKIRVVSDNWILQIQ